LTTLERHRQDWEELADVDPLWAILASPQGRGGKWDLDAFFASGEREIAEVLRIAQGLGYPRSRERALDFGCGVGRLPRALGGSFGEAVGLDISAEMVRLASELNDGKNCRFELNVRSDVGGFESGTFDFVYSALVLQHMPRRELIRTYVGEFIRVLGPGGLAVFQCLAHLPPALRLQPRRRAYAALRRLGVPHQMLLERLHLVPTRLTAITEDDVQATVAAAGGVIEHMEEHPKRSDGVRSVRYYVRTA
jgi:SAM-dependent methyltransferase